MDGTGFGFCPIVGMGIGLLLCYQRTAIYLVSFVTKKISFMSPQTLRRRRGSNTLSPSIRLLGQNEGPQNMYRVLNPGPQLGWVVGYFSDA